MSEPLFTPNISGSEIKAALRQIVHSVLSEMGLGSQVRDLRLARVASCDAEAHECTIHPLLANGNDDPTAPELKAVELPFYVKSLGTGSIVRFAYIYNSRAGLSIIGIELAKDPVWRVPSGSSYVEIKQDGVTIGGQTIILDGTTIKIGSADAVQSAMLGELFVDQLVLQLATCSISVAGVPVPITLTVPAGMSPALKGTCLSSKVKVAP